MYSHYQILTGEESQSSCCEEEVEETTTSCSSSNSTQYFRDFPTQDISIGVEPSHGDSIPKECLIYNVRRDPKDYHYWNVEFPIILQGIVDMGEYYQAITAFNQIIARVHKKWCYTDGFVATMFITGGLVLLPLIPAVALSVRKVKKINKNIQAHIETLNSNSYSRSYEWVLENTAGGILGKLGIKFLNEHKILPQQKFMLLQQLGPTAPSGTYSAAWSGPATF